jgi:glycerophosphoryl diester phosphodiesterase
MSINNICLYTPLSVAVNSTKVEKSTESSFDEISTKEAQDDFSSGMNVIAHRGYSDVAPENTIPAFIAAAEAGYTTVECDIEWTKDGVPVLLHDKNINRTARTQDGWKYLFPRKCSSYTYDELLKFDFGSWKDEKYKGTKIPTFTELLDCAKEYGLNVYVELKQNGAFDEEKAQILTQAVKEAGFEDNITWISFDANYLKMISEYMPEARLGFLSSKEVSEKTISVLQDLKTEENEVFLDVSSSKINKEADSMLDEAGFPFEIWDVNDNSRLQEFYEYECSGITTDRLTDEDIDEYLSELYNEN